MENKFIGKRFGRLIVVEKIKACVETKGRTKYLCICDCGNEVLLESYKLTSKHTRSCGCYRKEVAAINSKKYNTYDLTGDYGIGYTTKGEEFWFDLIDYNKIKNHCWRVESNGYVINGYDVYMHRFIMNAKIYNQVDHINHNTNDNRKSNLRLCTISQNRYNSVINKNNTSGVKGVYWLKGRERWRARISINKENIHLGDFINLEDAKNAREQAEKKYQKDFRYKGE